MTRRLTITALAGIGEVCPGDDLAEILLSALDASGETLHRGDILVIAQKIVSKAEGRQVRLADVTASPGATTLAAAVDKDPRQVELVLRESRAVVRHRPGVLIVETRHGMVMANAGIDHSNVGHDPQDEQVLLLPCDPDASAARLRDQLQERCHVDVGIVINDSVGRAWRLGTTGLAIGVAGLPALVDLRGRHDRNGRELLVSEQAVADELAAAASLLQGQASEGLPVVLIRGFSADAPDGDARSLVRPRELDMFR